MSDCLRPLDPIDAEALAAGADPLFAPDAAAHAAACAACGGAVERAALLTRDLEGLSQEDSPVPDLASRVIRLREFSRHERRTYALWRAPVLLAGGLAAGGFALVLAPSLSGSDQVGLGAALLVPTLAFFRSAARWVPELLRVAPTALEALSEAFRAERGLGLTALLLLVPAAVGFRWVLSRERSRR